MPWFRDLRYAIRRRARRARYAADDLAYAARRETRRISSGVRSRWSRLAPRSRRRLTVGFAIAAGLAVLVLVVTPNLPCQAPGGKECQPGDDAIALVPGDATAYAHAAIDPDTDQYERAAAIAEGLPGVGEQLIRRLPGPSGAGVDYRRDVAPWLGDEAAMALIPAGGDEDPSPTVLLEIGDAEGAAGFVEDLVGSNPDVEAHGEIDVSRADGVAVAEVGGFVVAGRRSQVERVIDTDGTARSLADSGEAEDVLDALPEPHLAELYVSEQGASELLAPGRALGSFEVFVNAEATRGAAAALVAKDDGLEVAIHSSLDPERAESSPGFLAAFPPFEPALAAEVSEGALAYLALGDPGRSVAGLLAQASVEAPALARGFERIVDRVRKAGDVDLERELLPLLTSQAAVSVEPRSAAGGGGQPEAEVPAEEGEPPLAPPGSDVLGVPFVSLIVGDVDAERASRALARLQAPIARALDPASSGQAPRFEEREIDGVPVQSLRLSPTVELAYAVIDGKLVVSTDPLGIVQVERGDGGLDDSERFQRATDGLSDAVSALLYLNLADLLQLAEQAGLGADPAYAPFATELRRLSGLGVAVQRDVEEIDTEIHLTVDA